MGETNGALKYLWHRMKRRKTINTHDHGTQLRRCLTTVHLIFMGVGSTVGVGIYVLVGVAAKEYAGPGVLLSFIMAGVVTLLNALCYAEFGARIPKTGAVYTYVYEATCEFLAFLVGWLNLLGLITSGAIAARAWSGYLDSVFNKYIHDKTLEAVGPVTLGPPFSPNIDFLAFGYEVLVIIIISSGIQASAFISSILAGVSVIVLVFVSAMGLIVGDFSNISNSDNGGFLPFGWAGVMAGTAACFYAYQGFDTICMSAEETKSPNKSVPRAIFFELLVVTILYVGSSCGLLLLVPYGQIDTRAPLPSAFTFRDIQWAKYVVSIGPTLGIGNLNILNLFNLSRQVYSMSSDGLFFKMFLSINEKTKVPVKATLVMGSLVAVFALFLDITDLVKFNVIAMFFAFIISNTILIVSRDKTSTEPQTFKSEDTNALEGDSSPSENGRLGTSGELKSSIIDSIAEGIGLTKLLLFVIAASLCLGLQSVLGIEDIKAGKAVAIFYLIVLITLIITLSLLIARRTGPPRHEGFNVKFVPYLPILSIVINSLLLIAAADVSGVVGYCAILLVGVIAYVALVLCSDKGGDLDTLTSNVAGKEEETSLIGQHDDPDEDDLFE